MKMEQNMVIYRHKQTGLWYTIRTVTYDGKDYLEATEHMMPYDASRVLHRVSETDFDKAKNV
jgi:hypothetical protein